MRNGGSTGCTGFNFYSGLAASYVAYASWNATKGWDPVTGLGTPNFQELLALTTPYNKFGLSVKNRDVEAMWFLFEWWLPKYAF